jgi:retinol dehydrogenase 14
MTDKIATVTGANSGIGMAISKEFARRGANVVMVCRSQNKGEAARSEVASATSNEKVELMLADLSSLESVRRLVSSFRQKHNELHVLVNNAAVVEGSRILTKDGLEEVFVVNYLSHFLLTSLLLDVLKNSAPSRIVNVASSVHAHIDFEDLQMEKHYNPIRSYGQSKLAQILFTQELSRRLEGTGVTVNSVHPGAVRTHLGDEGGLVGIAIKFLRNFYASPEKGAEGPVFVATSKEMDGVTGAYFARTRRKSLPPEATDREIAKRLWKVSMNLCGLSETVNS